MKKMVNISTRSMPDYTELKVEGEVDASSSIQLDDALGELVRNGPAPILVNCTGLTYISSAGLGVFMSYIEELDSRQQKMVLYGLEPKVRHAFDILGLDQLLSIAETKEEALSLLL